MNVTKAKRVELKCGHCSSVFIGSYAQDYNQRTNGTTPCCSTICRQALLRSKFSTPVPNRGPCLGCGDSFSSRREAKFCGIKCYTGSQQFTDMLAAARAESLSPYSVQKRAEGLRRGEGKPCLECGVDVYMKKSEKSKKYCSKPCYRAYMAKRFDRHIANPETLQLPQGYDAFLDRDELPCLVDGCGWVGRHLSMHVNQMHGIQADDFKRAAGFNRSTGVISRSLAEVLRDRPHQGGALDAAAAFAGFERTVFPREYQSLEGAEHRTKSRLLSGPGPVGCCKECGGTFQQKTVCGRQLYCSVKCRSDNYKRTYQRPNKRVEA